MKLRVEPVESGADILNFPVAMIVFAVAESGPSKVKAQHGKAKTIQRFHRMEHDLVMQGPAKQRMRMTNHPRMRGMVRACVQQCFQLSCGAFQEERPDC